MVEKQLDAQDLRNAYLEGADDMEKIQSRLFREVALEANRKFILTQRDLEIKQLFDKWKCLGCGRYPSVDWKHYENPNWAGFTCGEKGCVLKKLAEQEARLKLLENRLLARGLNKKTK